MQVLTSKLVGLSTLALLGVSGAQASIILNTASGGSESIASFVNGAGDSISLDLGEQLGALNAGDAYALTPGILSFISAAGGLSGVTFGIIAGNSPTRNYLTSSASETFEDDQSAANSAKALWASSLNGLIQNLNTGDATPASTNLAYGPFLSGSGSPNYLDGGHSDWQSGDFQFSTLTPGTDLLYLYGIAFADGNTGLAPFTPFNNLGARVNLSTNQLELGPVPVPAAVWLFGSALGLLGVARRRSEAGG